MLFQRVIFEIEEILPILIRPILVARITGHHAQRGFVTNLADGDRSNAVSLSRSDGKQ